MKTKPFLTLLLVLLGLAAATTSAFFIGNLFPHSGQVSATGDPPFSPLDLPSQTMNGITAQIESYYADVNRLIFVVRIDGEREDYFLEDISLQGANHEEVYESYEVHSLSDDASAFSVDLITANPLEGERLDGQFAFKVFASDGEDPPVADFQFGLNLPVTPKLILNPKQSISANGVEILLDRVVIAPAFTQAYLCYVVPTNADWGINKDSTLQINSQVGSMQTYSILFDAELADGGQGIEPGWTPPVQNGRCVKIGFQVGDAHPQSLTLTIRALEQSMPADIPEDDLAAAYKKLKADGIDLEWHPVDNGAYLEYKKIPEGVTRDDAYRQFAQTLGYIYPGEWIFEIPDLAGQ